MKLGDYPDVVNESVTRIVPKLGILFQPTAGPPKRYAQLVGFVFASTSIVLFLLGSLTAYKVVLGILVFFASLESFLGWCAGCLFFRILMKLGIIPDDVCEKCNQLNFNK